MQETDPTTALASSNVAYIAGQVDMSRQLFDFARPGLDLVLAADLGADLGARVDVQAVQGTNANGQTLGLANVGGIVSVSYTDASPTPGELVSKIWEAYRQLADATVGYGVSDPGAYLTIMHPGRYAWLQAGFSTPIDELLPGTVVQSAGIRSTLGAGTNEDEIFILVRDESFLCLDAPTFAVYPEVGSSTLTVRVQARQALAAMLARQPKSIARIFGTGLANVTL